MNRTFSPEKESEEAKDQTFTEETADVAINDKTFSPVPSTVVKKMSTPRVASLKPPKSATKSVGKKKSPQLKRLQGNSK